MSKLPYGGFQMKSAYEGDPGWKKLEAIAKYLECAEVLPPYLARWLGEAICRSAGDSSELLRRLGLKNRRGRIRSKFSDDDAFNYGSYLCELEDSGLTPDRAINKLIEDREKYYEDRISDLKKEGFQEEEAIDLTESELPWEPPSRSQLQKWRNAHRFALEETRRINDENRCP